MGFFSGLPGVVEVWSVVGTGSTDNSPEDAVSAKTALDHCPWCLRKLSLAILEQLLYTRSNVNVLCVFSQLSFVTALRYMCI